MIILAAISILTTVIYSAFFVVPHIHKLGRKILEAGGELAPAMAQDPLLYTALPAILNIKSNALEYCQEGHRKELLKKARLNMGVFVGLALISFALVFSVLVGKP